MESHPIVAGWQRLKILGNGSFGQLSLWKDLNSQKLVAVKICKHQLQDVKEKHRNYWVKEVDIMYKLDHPNVVKAVVLPPQLVASLQCDLPPLGLEYCTGGDLRRVLARTENLCGLPEKELRWILHDICQGLTYLHKERIIHRDIKPENIVIQDNGDQRNVYKIIDLGYAKELEQSSLMQSFVGTLVYLAPELFEQQKYTFAVDYWSLGVLAFEIATGVRPFFHEQSPVEWMSIVKHKRDAVIYATRTPHGNEFSTKMPDWCRQLNEQFKLDLTVWLRWMLAYNPKHRVGDNRRSPLDVMLAMLSRRVAHVVDTNSQKVITFNEDSTCDDLYTSTMVPINNQLLLSADGHEVVFGDLLLLGTEHVEEASITAYLFHLGGSYSLAADGLPPRIRTMLARSPGVMAYPEQKQLWQHMYHHVHHEFINCCRTLSGYRALLLHLNAVHNDFHAKLNNLSSIYKEVKVLAQTLKEAHDYDRVQMQKFAHSALDELRSVGNGGGDALQRIVSGIKDKMREIVARANAFHKRLVKLRENPFGRSKPPEALEALHDAVLQMLKTLRQRNSVERKEHKSNVDMVKAVEEFRQEHERVLKEVAGHMVDVLAHIKELREAVTNTNMLLTEVTKEHAKLRLQHQSRYTAMWNVIKRLMVDEPNAMSVGMSSANGNRDENDSRPNGGRVDSVTRVPDVDMIVRENESYRSALDSLNSLMETEFGGFICGSSNGTGAANGGNTGINQNFSSFL